MSLIDKIFTDYPFYGSRRIRHELGQTYRLLIARDHKSYRTIGEANLGLTEYFQFYNTKRPHQSLDYQTPSTVYFH